MKKIVIEFDMNKLTVGDLKNLEKMGGNVVEFKEENICCLCGEQFTGYGCNPFPLASAGKVCCGKCDGYVMLARVDMVYLRKSVEEVKEIYKNGGYRCFRENI